MIAAEKALLIRRCRILRGGAEILNPGASGVKSLTEVRNRYPDYIGCGIPYKLRHAEFPAQALKIAEKVTQLGGSSLLPPTSNASQRHARRRNKEVRHPRP